MKEEKIQRLIEQLNKYLDMDSSGLSISPTSPPLPDGQTVCLGVTITKDIDFDKMSDSQLLLAHCLLHKFYATGNKELNKEDLIYLHKEILPYVEEHMEHLRFDKLDDH